MTFTRLPMLLFLLAATALAACGAHAVSGNADGAIDDVVTIPDSVELPDVIILPPEDVIVPPVDVPIIPDVVELPDGWMTAPHDPFPQVPNQGGPLLANPELILLIFPGVSDPAADVSYAHWIVGSSWLSTVGAEYGVGLGSVVTTVNLTTSPPHAITSDQIETFLLDGVTGGTLPQPADGLTNALYVLYYPSSTTITLNDMGQLSTSCHDFGGYHKEVDGPSNVFSYAVIPDCMGFAPGITRQQAIDIAVSHELIEAATDADPLLQPAYQLMLDMTNPSPWVLIGGEIADLCLGRYDRSGTYIAQQIWSNAAAAAGGDPCIPSSGGTYFNVSSMPEDIQLVQAGHSVTFTLTGWSTAPVADWTIGASVQQATFMPDVNLTPMTINNGMTATVNVTVPAGTPSGSYAAIVIDSTAMMGTNNQWPLGVFVQ